MRAWLPIILITLLGTGRATAQERPSLAVVGMVSEIDHEQWQDARVGLGVRALLSQLFFDSDQFDLLEEKAGMREILQGLAARIWSDELDDLESELDTLDPDFAAYGKVIYFGRPRTRMSLGPLHRNSETIEIRVEVTLEDLRKGKKIKKNGRGQTKTVATSALFVFDEDRAEFDESTVGTATREALENAVAAVLKEYEKKYGG